VVRERSRREGYALISVSTSSNSISRSDSASYVMVDSSCGAAMVDWGGRRLLMP